MTRTTYSILQNIALVLVLVISAPLQAKPFIVGRLMGQFGNQLFQIAATVSLALDHDATPVFPDLKGSREFNIPLNYEKVFFHLDTVQPGPIGHAFFDPNSYYTPIPYSPNMSIQGWFQSEKYFIRHKEEILKLFAPSQPIKEYIDRKYGDLLAYPQTVALHVRSYLREDPSGSMHPTYGTEYYKKAVMEFSEDSIFVVCTNDLAWSKAILADIPRTFVFIEGEPHYHDFYIMSLCKHNIIANSSFSWWSAYLNSNPEKKVVAPRKWFNPARGLNISDVVPPGWVIID